MEVRLESGSEPVRQNRLLSFLLSKNVPHLPTDEERKIYPEGTTNFFYRFFFWWLNPVMRTGYKRTLEPQDLFKLSDDIRIENMANRFYHYFERDLERARIKHIETKCKQRGETLATTKVAAEEDLDDFELSKFTTVFALFKTFKYQYSAACIFLCMANSASTCNPLLLKKLIQYVERKAMGHEEGIGRGLGYSFGASAIVFLIGVSINHFFYRSMLTGAQAKAVLTKALLDKSFRLSAEAKHKYPVGKITSMMGTDLARIDFAIGFQPFLIIFPIPIIIAVAILIVNIGVSALVGVAILAFFFCGIAVSTRKLFAYRFTANKFTDARVDFIKEALNNLKIIKFYSWEPPYHENISDIRKKEMRIIYRMQVLRNIITAFSMCLTLFASMISFLVLYAVDKNGKDPASIFSSISLFNVLTQQVFLVPMALSSGADAYLGIGRVGEYLSSSETNLEETRIHADGNKLIEMDKDNVAIEIKGACFEWDTFDDNEVENLDDVDGKDRPEEGEGEKAKQVLPAKAAEIKTQHTHKETFLEKKNSTKTFVRSGSNSTDKEEDTDLSSDDEATFPGLTNINLTIKKNEFVVVTGLIGTGKSSLLNAMSGFMRRTSGSVNVDGDLLLCGYPWVQNATVRDNIVFGLEWDEKRYNNVIYACSLESDLEILPAGDQTEIGERGITLSGGQKARINLARAVYAERDVILMDDVLSAVDARVGRHIMNNCILGLLKDKTRVLATHQLSLIGSADKVVYLNGDGTIDVGTFEELKVRNFSFSNLMAYNSESKEEVEEEEVEEDEEAIENEREMIQRQISKVTKPEDEEAAHKDFNKNEHRDGHLTEQEERAVNGINAEVYKQYFKLGSGKFSPWIFCPLLISLMILSTFCQLFTNTWLSFWTEFKFTNKSDGFYIGFYVMFTVLSFILLTCEFVMLVYLTNTASVRLNIMAIEKVLHAPMAFMDTTPMGRILNRFTKDTDVLDNEIGDQLRFLVFVFANIIGVLILCVIYLPWFAIAIPFLGFLFVAVANYYQASAREIKRLEAVQRSFVYNNFNETLSGMNTIKAYNAEYRFLEKNNELIDNMNEAYYLTIANQRWLAIHMDIIATIFALLIALLCVNRIFNISAASVGLLLSYVFQIAGQLSMLIRTFTQVENEMNSAERLASYAFHLPEEAPYLINDRTPAPSWPNKGIVRFDKASLAYRPGLPLVLKNLSFEVKPSEKIGICGRTGAGKSSIMTALYRLSELESGKITIDDVDIANLGLKDLRSKLSIIPQDPVLFRGTIRKNLDPFNESSDDKLWDALVRTGLIDPTRLEIVKKQVKTQSTEDEEGSSLHKFHLDQQVEDEGSNFSLGERQLIAFARALVRDSKILILDEATSSVDYETDFKIQTSIIKEFSQCTILCIAHRLKTIINYDRVLVLDKGEIKEFDTPWNLFNTSNGIFQQMCQKSNITEEDFANLKNF